MPDRKLSIIILIAFLLVVIFVFWRSLKNNKWPIMPEAASSVSAGN